MKCHMLSLIKTLIEPYLFRLNLNFPKGPTCIFCGSKAFEYHGYTPSTLKHIAADPSFPVFIELKKHRAKCLNCGHCFQAEDADLAPKYAQKTN